MNDEPQAPALPASDQMTEDQQRDAINSAATNAQACRALGIHVNNSTGLRARCKRLGIAVPSERGKPVTIPKLKMTPKPEAPEARQRELEAKAEASQAPATAPGQLWPQQAAARQIAALRGVLRILEDLDDLGACHRLIGSLAILLGADIRHEQKF